MQRSPISTKVLLDVVEQSGSNSCDQRHFDEPSELKTEVFPS